MITLKRTTAIDHGRREAALFSPWLCKNGVAMSSIPITTGARIIT